MNNKHDAAKRASKGVLGQKFRGQTFNAIGRMALSETVAARVAERRSIA
jgi:hypothetical protein